MSDYISREQLINEWDDLSRRYAMPTTPIHKRAFKEFPSADVRENMHGKWISELELYGEGKWNYQCSVCGRSIRLEQNEILDDYPFCHCGADMRGE